MVGGYQYRCRASMMIIFERQMINYDGDDYFGVFSCQAFDFVS